MNTEKATDSIMNISMMAIFNSAAFHVQDSEKFKSEIDAWDKVIADIDSISIISTLGQGMDEDDDYGGVDDLMETSLECAAKVYYNAPLPTHRYTVWKKTENGNDVFIVLFPGAVEDCDIIEEGYYPVKFYKMSEEGWEKSQSGAQQGFIYRAEI
jgi:hypothetical protein